MTITRDEYQRVSSEDADKAVLIAIYHMVGYHSPTTYDRLRAIRLKNGVIEFVWDSEPTTEDTTMIHWIMEKTHWTWNITPFYALWSIARGTCSQKGD